MQGKPSIWRDKPELQTTLAQCIEDKISAAQAVMRFHEEYGLIFTRSAIIGRANRLGLSFKSIEAVKRAKRDRTSTANFKRKRAFPAIFIAPVFPYRNNPEILQPEYLNVPLMRLGQFECHFIAGNDHLYCGAPATNGTDYCDFHYNLMHIYTPKPKVRSWRDNP